MDSEIINDEQMIGSNNKGKTTATTIKSRVKDRSRSQTSISSNADINDPENLDYEEEDVVKMDDDPLNKSNENLSHNLNETKETSREIQNDSSQIAKESNNNNHRSPPPSETCPNVSDEGELDEADLEDGEIHDPNVSKMKMAPVDDSQCDQNRMRTNSNLPSPQGKVHCRFFLQGRCNWGPSCKYGHLINETTKTDNNSLTIDGSVSSNTEISSPSAATLSLPSTPNSSWAPSPMVAPVTRFFPNHPVHAPLQIPRVPPGDTESAWERGLRSAKTLREQSMRRKQQDKDFNEKKFNLSVRDATDDKELEGNLERPARNDYDSNDLSGSNYADNSNYSDRYHPYSYSNHSNNHRMNNHTRSNMAVSNHDRRVRHNDDYGHERQRAEKTSMKHQKSSSRRDKLSPLTRNSTQKQYSSGSHHDNVDQIHENSYSNRRAEEWHDPWDRSRNHGSSNNRRSSGAGRKPSYSSSSRSLSSSSRSSRTRSSSSSSSSRSRSRSRSRPKRRSPSVTRTTKSSETIKNGNEKKSNGNKKSIPSSPPAATNKFLPGRQISSHTLKKAEKSSNHSHSTSNHHGKDTSNRRSKASTRKDRLDRSDSTSSSSSSSNSDTKRTTRRSSSSSSDSSSSENESKASPVHKSKSGSSTAAKISSNNHSISRQSASSLTGTTTTSKVSKSTTNESSKKKHRDTSSSTGSTPVTISKKMKLNSDSQKSSADPNHLESSTSSKAKKQKVFKELFEVEKLLSQKSTKTSS